MRGADGSVPACPRLQRQALDHRLRAVRVHSRADLLSGIRAGGQLRDAIGFPALIALATVIVGYAALWLADLAFKIDFRFWIVALKLMSAGQFLIFLIYLVPLTALFVIALHVLHRNFSTMGAGRGALYLTNILALTLGFIVLPGLQYGILWLTGMLFNPLPDPSFVPLSTIIAIQFGPLLAIAAMIATFTWRRTGSSLPGALIRGIFRDLVGGGRHGHAGGVLGQ